MYDKRNQKTILPLHLINIYSSLYFIKRYSDIFRMILNFNYFIPFSIHIVYLKNTIVEDMQEWTGDTQQYAHIFFNYRILFALLCSSTENYYVRHSFMNKKTAERIFIVDLRRNIICVLNYYHYYYVSMQKRINITVGLIYQKIGNNLLNLLNFASKMLEAPLFEIL